MLTDVLPAEAFRRDFYERKPYLARLAANRFAYSWSDLDLALGRVEPTLERVKLLNGSRVDNRHFAEDFKSFGRLKTRFIKDVLYSHLSAGATLVVNSLEESCGIVAEICREIGQYALCGVTANAYASFGGPAATNIHWDTHDVFVVQLLGKKHWQVFEPTLELPVSNQVSNHRKSEAPQNPSLDLILEEGDVLYLPRGWWHRVSPIDGAETIHLAVGLHPPLVLDYLLWACAHKLTDEISFRRSLIGAEGEADTVTEAAERLLEILKSPESLEAFHRRALERQRTDTPFNISSLIKHADEPLPADAKLHANVKYLSPGHAAQINGNVINLRDLDQRIFEKLVATPGVRVAELSETLGAENPSDVDAALKHLLKRDIVSMGIARA